MKKLLYGMNFTVDFIHMYLSNYSSKSTMPITLPFVENKFINVRYEKIFTIGNKINKFTFIQEYAFIGFR